jgi:hypothetical protein
MSLLMILKEDHRFCQKKKKKTIDSYSIAYLFQYTKLAMNLDILTT